MLEIFHEKRKSLHVQGFPYWGMGGVPPPAKNLFISPNRKTSSPPTRFLFSPSHQRLIPPTKLQFLCYNSIKNFIFSCSHCSCTIFIISCSFHTQAMLILILNEVQYLQNVAFSFEKFLNGQDDSFTGFHCPIKKSPQQNSPSLHPLRYLENPDMGIILV